MGLHFFSFCGGCHSHLLGYQPTTTLHPNLHARYLCPHSTSRAFTSSPEISSEPVKPHRNSQKITTMAACFRTLPFSHAIPSSSSSPKRRTSGSNNNLKVNCFGSLNTGNSAKIPMPPLNPKDPFLSRLASVAANSPSSLLDRPVNSDAPPYLDLCGSPKMMSAPAQVERSVSYNDLSDEEPPPDLPSLLLDARIVYIGMPLVAAVTELVVAELMFLQWADPKAPIYMYINSTGTTRDDGEAVGMESEAFAIYDSMMQMQNEIHTVAVGAAIGQACLILAAGTKGKRFMMPHAKVMIQQPRVPSSGLLPAADVLIRAKEAMVQRETLTELLAKHTENSVETVRDAMRRPFYMDGKKAKDFGVIDKVLRDGDEKIIGDVPSPDDYARRAGMGGREDEF